MSVYAHDSNTAGSAYAQQGIAGGSPYAGGGNGGSPKKKHGHGFFHRFASDIYNAAVNSPAGLYELGKLAVKPEQVTYTLLTKGNRQAVKQSRQGGVQAETLAKAYAAQLRSDLSHPLRHPGYTTLDLLPVLGAAGRVAEAGTLAKGGASLGDVAKAATVGAKPEPRILRVGGAEARGHYSRAAAARLTQKAADTLLQKGAGRSPRVENLLHRRAAKWNERTLRVQESVARTVSTRLAAAGRKLSPAEQRALRIVAEQVPVERRLGAMEMRKARATSGKEIARHQQRIDITRQAADLLTTDDAGKPVFKPEQTKLKRIYGLLQEASADREAMLNNLGLMEQEAQAAAKTKGARIAAGAHVAPAVAAANGNLDIGATVRLLGQTATGKVAHLHDNGDATVFYPRFNRSVTVPAAKLETVSPPKLQGAEDIHVTPDAPFIGAPAEQARISGRPKVSSTGTFGHTPKPGSLKTATGGSIEHALERNDTTQLVAERHAEAVRLSEIHRRVDLVKAAGETVPRRKDDVWVWTDKTVSQERIPKDVRRYLDNPDGIVKLPEGEQQSILDQIKAATLERHNWQTDAEARHQFEQLAQEGKGVFLPRRLLGNAAKASPNIAAVPGVGVVDAVNNAQKAALVYLKLNYPVVQGLSNIGMGLIHQGFAYPKNLTQAALLSHRIGPEMAAVVDDIMGQGAVMQAAFHGTGTVSRASQKLAEVMSHSVDTPARRAAFLHEAAKAGYGTPERLTQLLEDPQHVHQLAEVAQKAKEAIVDYGELSPTERSLVRRLIFVYPWQKGATKYAGQFFRDHPAQAAAAGMLGQQGAQTVNEKLGPVPSYLGGVFPAGDRLVNPNGVNFFQTPAQIGGALAGYATGNPASSSGQDFLAPFPALAVALATRRDSLGRPLKGNLLHNIDQTLVEQAPVVQLAKAAAGRGKPSKTFPDPNDPLWRFLLGGLYPRRYSKPALNRNAGLERTGR